MSPSERAAVDQAHRQFGEPTATPKPRAGEHTKGPWRVDNSGYPTIVAGEQVVTRVNGHSDFDKDDRANARRIVACVNYLEGFKTEDLEQRRDNQASLWEERDLLRERERELVEALKAASEALRSSRHIMGDAYNRELAVELADKCDAALAKHGR